MIRTLMDKRYYYGIRQEAASVLTRVCTLRTWLTKCATENLGWVGEYHLLRAFQQFFCFRMSTTPLSNDFSDFQQYFIKCTIPMALARIKDGSGDTRNTVKMFLIKMLKYNENSNNEVIPFWGKTDVVL